MSRKLRQWVFSLLMGMAVAMMPFQVFDAFAATAKIAFSDPTAKVGEEVSVTMKFTCTSGEALGNTDVMLAYDSSMLEFINETDNASGGSGAIRVWSGVDGTSEVATTLRFRALKAGTAEITVTSWEGYDNDGQTLTMEKEGSSRIQIAAAETSSNDADLVSLQVSPGTLEPAFSADVDSYSVSVGLGTERLNISAVPKSDKATVTVEGNESLADGDNTILCKVTAEDGSTVKTYTIHASRVEGGAESESTGEQTPEAEVLATLDIAAKTVEFLAVPENLEIPEGFKESSIAIGDSRVPGWTWAAEETPSYCVFYGRIGDGEPGLYRYDLTEKTVQRYFQDPAGENAVGTETYVELAENYNSLLEDFQVRLYIIIGLGALSAVLLITLVVVLARGRKGDNPYARLDGQEPEEEPKKTSRAHHGKKMTKEERYMMGEEDEYEDFEEEELEPDPDEYLPEPVQDVEAAIAANLAKEAAAAKEEEYLDEDTDEDDFEFFDLDE